MIPPGDEQTEVAGETDLPGAADGSDAKCDGFVVGIGASAGGLEALERFFSNCPADTGAAFVVVQHLSPDHKSMMLDLLGRYTTMPVVMVEHGLPIEPNKIFLIPAGTVMRVADQRFDLKPKVPHILTLPIDIFFTSLAEMCGRKAVAVVLSGTGSDGTRGGMTINAAGGFVIAQDPMAAKFDGMPKSIIATGLVDAVLNAEDMPARIAMYLKNLPMASLLDVRHSVSVPVSDEEAYDAILQLLVQGTGIDFRDYKLATVLRRIERRMQVRHAADIRQYSGLLENDPHEVQTLKREMLIPVTSFFRDSDAFAVLESKVIAQIVANADSNTNLRAWVAGTSTGEEAYTLAMLFLEAFERERRWPNLKIFATDVSQENIDVAAAGTYAESTAAEIAPERLDRFFARSGSTLTVKPELRRAIVFARHNLLVDPPFTQMDLVSCRNTLIYFNQDAQRKALQRLQFATRVKGYLFLGSSESLSNGDMGFRSVDSTHKLFQRASDAPLAFSGNAADMFRQKLASRRQQRPRVRSTGGLEQGAMLDVATRTLLQHYAPPAMLVNNHNEIIHLFGSVQPFFRAREGSASLELSRVLPETVVPVASALIFKAARDHQRQVSDRIRVAEEHGEGHFLVRLAVIPIETSGEEALLLLCFEPIAEPSASDALSPVDVDAETLARMGLLESELQATRESLQATIEELETSNEELQATNEELMASNEELQSSNEELQSVNEELNTVNAEYQEKVGILNRVNADLDSMAKAVGVATVFVDEDLNITRFSPDAVGIFKLRNTDLHRPLDEITNNLEYPDLIEDLASTIRTERMNQKEVTAADGALFLTRLMPYRISGDRRGAVATFIDITAFRDRQRLQVVLDALPEHVAVLESTGRIVMTNRAWDNFAKLNGDPLLQRSASGCNYLDVCRVDGEYPDGDAEQAYRGIKAVLEGNLPMFQFEYPCHSPDEQRWFLMYVAPIVGHGYAAVVSHINITPWYLGESRLQG